LLASTQEFSRWHAVFCRSWLCWLWLASVVWLPIDAGEKAGSRRSWFKGHGDAVLRSRLAGWGRLLATASFDNTLKLWDAATGKEVRTYGGTLGIPSR